LGRTSSLTLGEKAHQGASRSFPLPSRSLKLHYTPTHSDYRERESFIFLSRLLTHKKEFKTKYKGRKRDSNILKWNMKCLLTR
jgi:hypothetical protein